MDGIMDSKSIGGVKNFSHQLSLFHYQTPGIRWQYRENCDVDNFPFRPVFLSFSALSLVMAGIFTCTKGNSYY